MNEERLDTVQTYIILGPAQVEWSLSFTLQCSQVHLSDNNAAVLRPVVPMSIPRQTAYPTNTEHLYNIYTMLDQRRRRWADVV